MTNKTAPAGELSESEIQDIANEFMQQIDSHHGSETVITKGDLIDFASAIITADRALRASPVLATLQTERDEITEINHTLWQVIAALTAERDALSQDYGKACKLVADMHMAAMGSVTGPVIGVVEDVAALKAERDALRSTLVPPQFPVVLRKMWSGSDVQDWINAHWPHGWPSREIGKDDLTSWSCDQ